MAFDPTGQLGLPQDLEYSDILPSTQSGMPKGCDVIVAYNPAAPTYLGVGYMRGFYHPTRWGRTIYYAKDTTTGGWRPADYGANGYSYYAVEERFCGKWKMMMIAYATASLKDGVTAKPWIMIGGTQASAYGNATSLTLRYDTGLAGETGGVWRFSNWGKTYSYDYIPPEESGFMYDVFVPYTTGSLAVGTTATGYAHTHQFVKTSTNSDPSYIGRFLSSNLVSTGITYTCTQVTPTHKWQRG